jgi:4-amino-4-deoxy-L-arabinose transferase-like glycosyltransferase
VTPLLDASLALLVATVVSVAIATRVLKSVRSPEARFLRRTFWTTLALRYAGAIFLNAYSGESTFADTFWGDSSTYDYGGHLLSLYWSGQTYVPPPSAGTRVSGFGFHYFVGLVYFIFGQNKLLVQFLNGTIGAVSVLVVYAIARKLFDERVARWPALFMAFFPQMIFWSCAIYKDPAVLLCIGLSMYAVLRLRERFQPRYAALFVASCLALMTLRFYIFYMVAFATVGTFAFAQRRGVFSGVAAQLALAGGLMAAMTFAVRSETVEYQTSYFDLERLQITRSDQARWGQSAFAAELDVSTPEGVLAALPVGLVYLLFAPFPWSISGLRQLLTLPEMLVWYSLMPALVRGLRQTLRERLRESLPILVFAVTLTGAYAIFQGNVGTAYRQRTQITMFFFVFMGAGIEAKRRQREQRALREMTPRAAWQR